jgi:hypothetical protein
MFLLVFNREERMVRNDRISQAGAIKNERKIPTLPPLFKGRK